MNTSSVAAPPRSSGGVLVALGFGFAALGVIAYIVQIAAQRLTAPWYVPITATLGVLFVAVSLWRRRTVWRVFALLLLLLLAGVEWTFLLAMRLPAYTGPIAVRRPFPPFATARADGAAFTQDDL